MVTNEKKDKNRRIGFALLCLAVAVYALILTGATLRTGSIFSGEAASYTLTTVSLAHDGNAIVSEQDLAAARQWLPEWAEMYQEFGGSHYTTAQGTVPWYFPTYPAACLPLFWLLGLLGQPREYAFCLTNLICVLVVQAVVLSNRRLTLFQKASLCLLLEVHPAVFYISWPSAEVFQFALIALSAISWASEQRHRAALLIAVAGTTNPCILAIGLAMIGEYLVGLWKQGQGAPPARIRGMFARWKEVLVYACCYLPGLVPFAYNYAICGAINLTASYDGEWIPLNDLTLLRHFWAYFTDWNFGMLPYMPILLAVWAVLLVAAVIRRCGRYLWMNLGFMGALLGVSLMANINHGMSGISRYLAWSTALMAVAVGTQAPKILHGLRARRILAAALACSAVYTGGVIVAYGGIGAPRTDYLIITPIALKLVEHFPSLYQPLPVVLTMRSNIEVGLPDGWVDDDGDLRKLYLDRSQAEQVLAMVGSRSADDLAWLQENLNSLGGGKDHPDHPGKAAHLSGALDLYADQRTVLYFERRSAGGGPAYGAAGRVSVLDSGEGVPRRQLPRGAGCRLRPDAGRCTGPVSGDGGQWQRVGGPGFDAALPGWTCRTGCGTAGRHGEFELPDLSERGDRAAGAERGSHPPVLTKKKERGKGGRKTVTAKVMPQTPDKPGRRTLCIRLSRGKEGSYVH